MWPAQHQHQPHAAIQTRTALQPDAFDGRMGRRVEEKETWAQGGGGLYGVRLVRVYRVGSE